MPTVYENHVLNREIHFECTVEVTNIVRVAKSKRMRLTRHAACMGKWERIQNVSRKSEGKRELSKPSRRWKVILKGSRINRVRGCGMDSSRVLYKAENVQQLSEYRLLRNDSARLTSCCLSYQTSYFDLITVD